MSIELPLYKQEKDNTCALACLRMVLAAFGTRVEESVLESRAPMEEEGIFLDELASLARQFNLVADVRDTTVEQLRDILNNDRFPITFVDRAVFDLAPAQRARHRLRDAIIRSVIPVKLTDRWVTFHDPLLPRISRKTISRIPPSL